MLPWIDIVKEYKVPLLLGGIAVASITVSIILLVTSMQPTAPIQFSQDTEATGSAQGVATIAVDLEGAVVTPGFYTLVVGARVEDAIAAAGGFSKNADMDLVAKTINRAAKVADGGKIYIPVLGDKVQGHDNASTGVNINLATQSELEALPGIGPATAVKIIANRPYQTLEELVTKKALGQTLFDKLKDQLGL